MTMSAKLHGLILAAALTAACAIDNGQHSSRIPLGPVAPSQTSSVPLLAPGSPPAHLQTAAPSNPGQSGVFRYTDGSGFFIYDFERGVLVLHGSATLFTDICGGVTPPIFEPVDIQTIETASGLHWMFVDEAHPVQIYPAVPFGCPSLAVTPRLAAGTARITRVDNDLFGDDRAMNPAGWQASGTLADLVNGGTIRYNEIVRFLYDPRTGEVTELKTQVGLH